MTISADAESPVLNPVFHSTAPETPNTARPDSYRPHRK
jgi:hypothetical protein